MATTGIDEKRNAFERFTRLKATKGGAFEDHPALTVDESALRELSVAHFDREAGLYYVVTDKFADKKEIYTYDPVAKKLSEKPVFSHPEFDAEAVLVSSSPADFGKILAYSYNADVPRYEWLDAEFGGIVLGLEQQLNAESVNIIYRSPDFNLIVFSASGSNMPARYYILRDRSKLELLGAQRPWIETESLSQTGFLYYQARDGRSLPALFTPRQGWKEGDAPGKAIVLPHGGPWARDWGGWDVSGWVPFLTSRGYSVLQPQYRGTRGWGMDLWRAGDAQFGYKAQDDKDDGAAWLVSQGYADPGKIAIFGYSYGGYAAMAAATRKDSPYQCAIAGAGYAESDRINVSNDRTRFGRMAVADKLTGRDVIKDVANSEIPILIYHGDRDVRAGHLRKGLLQCRPQAHDGKIRQHPDMPHLPWTRAAPPVAQGDRKLPDQRVRSEVSRHQISNKGAPAAPFFARRNIRRRTVCAPLPSVGIAQQGPHAGHRHITNRLWTSGSTAGMRSSSTARFSRAVALCLRSAPMITRCFQSAGISMPQSSSSLQKKDSASGVSMIFRWRTISSYRYTCTPVPIQAAALNW